MPKISSHHKQSVYFKLGQRRKSATSGRSDLHKQQFDTSFRYAKNIIYVRQETRIPLWSSIPKKLLISGILNYE